MKKNNSKNYFEKVGFTGSWYEDGTNEVGYRCGHEHKTIEAARNCKTKCNYGNGGEVREYERSEESFLKDTWIESYGL
jgi:hypothetical protein